MESKKTWHEMHKEQTPFGERFAAGVAKAIGTPQFVVIQAVFVLLWVSVNTLKFMPHWDEYPYGLLGLIFAIQAALTAPLILIAQNKQVERDESLANEGYGTDVESKKEIEEMMMRINEMQTDGLERIFMSLEEIKITRQGKTD